MFDFNIEPSQEYETVTVRYLEALPMFGSVEWFDIHHKIRARALFPLMSEKGHPYSREEMIKMFTNQGMALLIESLPKAKGHNDSFRLKGVKVVVD